MTLRVLQYPAVRTLLAEPHRILAGTCRFLFATRRLRAGVCGLALLVLPVLMQPLQAQTAPADKVPVPVSIVPNATVVEDVVARVNDQIISRSDLERAQQQMEQENHQQSVSPVEAETRQSDLLRDLIDQQLLLSKGKEMNITGDTELVKRLDDIRKQNHFESMEDLEKAAQQQGVSFEDFKANIRNSIITQQVVRDEVGSRMRLSQADVQKYYDAHKQELSQPESERLSEILIPTPAAAGAAAPDDATVAAALAKANEVESKLKAGSKFDDLAKANSSGPTAQQGGDLGVFKRGALAKQLEDQTFDLAAGGYTQPIRTKQGYVILKVTEHIAAGIPPMQAVLPQLEEAIYSNQMQPALRAYLTRLREEAYIDIKPGFVDSGASSNESKPVFTAYVPPVVKKKKVVQKQRFDRHGKISTAKATAAPAAPVAAAALNGTSVGTTQVANNKMPAKPKKIKREKVRFGQAPRETLPAADNSANETVAAADASANGGVVPAKVGTAAMNPDVAQNAVPASPLSAVDADPLAPKAAAVKKGRYSDRSKIKKTVVKTKKVDPLTPPPATAQEQEALKRQSAPLGLNGDTAKKPKKHKHVKGEKKGRLRDKPKDPNNGQPAPLTPSANPSPLAPQPTQPLNGAPANDSGALHGTPAGSTAPAPAPPAATPAPPQN